MRHTADLSLQDDDLITLSVQSVSGEEVATVCVDGSWTVRHLARKIIEVAPIPSDTRYLFLWGGAILPFDRVLRSFVDGDTSTINVVVEIVGDVRWEECMGGCGAWLKAGNWGVCKGCYKNGYKGPPEEYADGFDVLGGSG